MMTKQSKSIGTEVFFDKKKKKNRLPLSFSAPNYLISSMSCHAQPPCLHAARRLMSPLLSLTKGCLRSYKRGFYLSSRHRRSSFRCWAQLCSERHCLSLVRNCTATRRTWVRSTPTLLPCCSHRCFVQPN